MMYANRLKTKVLGAERDDVQQHLRKYVKLNPMCNTKQRMENIMNTASTTPVVRNVHSTLNNFKDSDISELTSASNSR